MRLPLNFPRLLLIAALSTTPTILVPWHSAHAQDADDAEAEQEAEDAAKKQEARKAAKRAAPPSALPGAEASDDDGGGHARTDVNPTNALFDAINNGSLNAAKEALNRGADTGAHNVIDQTPLDMAIDLNRRDIMFLLLSMRAYNPDGHIESNISDDGIVMKDGNGHLSIGGTTAKKMAPRPVAPRFDQKGSHSDPASGFLGFAGR
ncbi:ankyrin repeat domain-containing protein [Swingsia samuiensis]|uniref:Ankyrin repeat domain-containing protein n=1 Tax=Swingsia samuiensis TaxID=1293412 RepID=A0A4Y6UIZ8_9PROT|nr:ankyrin repeat domain-containing protein [Swingsia samuiensis]QDH16446.1 ankyrin repeat domain-containing protein [Swingsia samuiensis]